MQGKRINDFTDKELADMVRNSIYAKNARFGDGPLDSRFLLVMAVHYGNDEGVNTLADAIDSYRRLLVDDDWDERDFQIYDHLAGQQFFAASMREVEASDQDEEPKCCRCERTIADAEYLNEGDGPRHMCCPV